MATQLNDIAVIINNEQIAYTADSLKWKDGFGEYSVRNAIVGGGQTLQIFSKMLDTKFGSFSMSLPSTVESEALKRKWKLKDNDNVIELIGPPGSTFSKVFSAACIINDPETDASTDGNIEIEFNTNPAV